MGKWIYFSTVIGIYLNIKMSLAFLLVLFRATHLYQALKILQNGWLWCFWHSEYLPPPPPPPAYPLLRNLHLHALIRVAISNFLSILKILELEFCRKITEITTKLKLRQECVNHIFNPSAFFFFLLTGATWYYHSI